MTRIRNAFIAVLLAVMTVAGVVSVVFKQPSGSVPVDVAMGSTALRTSLHGSIAPFPGEIVPRDTVVSQLAKRGLALYLPTKMAEGLQLTAVWAKVLDGQVGLPVIVVYSNTGDTAIATAELAIEIAGMSEIPWSVTNSSTDRFDKVGEWRAFISSRAPVGYEEYLLKYHTEFAYCMDIQIGSLNYLFRFSPVLTDEEVMEIGASMKPVVP